jgi:signal transduction histidine kinase
MTMNAAPEGCLSGGGEIGALMREKDWSLTPLGPVASWAQSLRTSVSICINSRFPIIIWWGPDLVMLYNDAYRDMTLKDRHPHALGAPGRQVYADIWPVIGPMLERVLHEGSATWSADLLLFIERHGYPEETYHTFSYSPIRDESGGIGGVFTPVTETTAAVLGARRVATLEDVASRAAEAFSVQAATAAVLGALKENESDIPFAIIYHLHESGSHASLGGTAGVLDRTDIAADEVAIYAEDPWPLHRVLEQNRALAMQLPARLAARLERRVWGVAPESAVVLPLRQSNQEHLAGFLIVGVNPRRRLDDDYRAFLDLLAGNVATVIVSASAYEQEKRRAEELAELDRAKTAFFSNVSHEFRTPLTLLLGPLEDLLADPSLDRRLEEGLRMVHRNAVRLLRLVNTLLDFSRLEAGRMEAVYAESDLSRLTRELAGVFGAIMERAGLDFRVDCQPLRHRYFVDEDMWEKIVFNLLSNAIKFTPSGHVAARLEEIGDGARLTVSDSGIGIPAEELPRLFERFHRVRTTGARTHEGSGIGLALVRELVELHGGTVSVESTLGMGTTFTVELPAGSAHLPAERIDATRTQVSTRSGSAAYLEEAERWLPEAHAPAAEDEPSEAEATILLVDDNADMRAYVSRLLATRWSLLTASNGEEALRILAGEAAVDLVLSDVMMPVLDGFGLLRAIREDPRRREVPVILLSARAGEEATVEGLEFGADDYLVKPFSPPELMARVASHLRIDRERREAAARERAARLEAEGLSRALAVHKDSLEAAVQQRTAELERRSEELAALNLRLQELDRLKSEFLATMSHELRTPLNAIIGFSELLRFLPEEELSAERRMQCVEHICNSGNLLLDLVNDILDLARIEAGRLELERAGVELAPLIRGALDMVAPLAGRKSISLEAEHLESSAFVDPARFTQIVLNLLSNAVKFTPQGGRVAVLVREGVDQVVIEVRDSGIGIPPNDQNRIFEAFEQAGAVPGEAQGSGLGLAICRRLVEAHGGTIEVESTPGRGSTFRVTLPRS